MDIQTLRAAHKRQLLKLDKFFHTFLWNNPHTRKHLEVHKAVLHGNLFEHMVRIVEKGTYATYDPDVLLFIKARKVYIAYVRSLQRESERNKLITKNVPPDDYASGSFRQELEARDAVSLIRKFLDPDDFNLLYMRGAEGRSYSQILQVVSFPSENAAKARYYKVKDLVKEHFGIQLIYKN